MSCLLTGEISQIWADNMGGSVFAFAHLSLPLFTFAFAFVFIFAFVFVFMVVFIFAIFYFAFCSPPLLVEQPPEQLLLSCCWTAEVETDQRTCDRQLSHHHGDYP